MKKKSDNSPKCMTDQVWADGMDIGRGLNEGREKCVS